jgi:hypothetical protein
MKKVGALWFRKSSKGVPYFSGILDGDDLPQGSKINVVVFKNDRASKDSSPTHIMYLSEPKGGGGSERGKSAPSSDNFFGDNDAGPGVDDDVAF